MSLFISIFKTALRIGIGVFAVIIIAEIILQCLPVKTGFKRPAEITAGHPPHWQPNQSFTYSSGWRMDNPRTGWINNKGYPAPHDYTDRTESIIVIGDSFVENQMNDWDESFMGHIEKNAALPVYAFGLSGATIADYMGLARYTSETYKPRHMIIVMQAGDINGAKSAYQPGHFYIEGNALKQEPYSHKNASIRNFFKQSALIRYVMMNLQIQNKIMPMITPKKTTTATVKKENPLDIFQFAIKELCKNARSKNYKITFAIESLELTEKQFQSTINACSNMTMVNVLALKSNLKKDNPNVRLDYAPYDGHWNAAMHGYVYKALKDKLPF